jgi:hypothetical protein
VRRFTISVIKVIKESSITVIKVISQNEIRKSSGHVWAYYGRGVIASLLISTLHNAAAFTMHCTQALRTKLHCTTLRYAVLRRTLRGNTLRYAALLYCAASAFCYLLLARLVLLLLSLVGNCCAGLRARATATLRCAALLIAPAAALRYALCSLSAAAICASGDMIIWVRPVHRYRDQDGPGT